MDGVDVAAYTEWSEATETQKATPTYVVTIEGLASICITEAAFHAAIRQAALDVVEKYQIKNVDSIKGPGGF